MTDLTHAPQLDAPAGAPLDACRQCAAPLVPDQRWCLNCGRRREGVDTPFATAPTTAAPAPVFEPRAAPVRPVDAGAPRWIYGALGFGVAVIVFVLGLVIGSASKDRRTLINVPAAAAPVVNVTAPAGGAAPAATDGTAAFTSDWPEGEDGWTVQLDKLPTDGSDAAAVAAAKTAAEGKGAPDVGALLSDDYASLPPSRYLVYSGVFETKGKATAALKDLRDDFPQAKVVEVSASGDSADEPVVTAPKHTDELTPDAFQKQSKKLPDKVGTEGTPPPVDKSKPAGGGSDTETIG